jgi:hypothetical protein
MSKKSFSLLAVLILITAILAPTRIVHADTGPKPIMDFELVYNIAPVSVLEGQLYFCEDEGCASPKLVAGPFHCGDNNCRYNYGGQGFYKLSITFGDKTRESNVFQKRGFVSMFKVDVNENELYIEQTNIALPYDLSVQFGGFLAALILTLVIELPLAGFLLKKWNVPRRWLYILFINLITLPFVWFIFPLLDNLIIAIGLGEFFAFMAEAIFYMYALRKDGLTGRQAIILSLVANTSSFLIPACLLFVILGVLIM